MKGCEEACVLHAPASATLAWLWSLSGRVGAATTPWKRMQGLGTSNLEEARTCRLAGRGAGWGREALGGAKPRRRACLLCTGHQSSHALAAGRPSRPRVATHQPVLGTGPAACLPVSLSPHGAWGRSPASFPRCPSIILDSTSSSRRRHLLVHQSRSQRLLQLAHGIAKAARNTPSQSSSHGAKCDRDDVLAWSSSLQGATD